MFVGLDLGTTAVKALLVGPDGHVLARESRPVRISHLPGGAVEQDIEEIWSATLAALRGLSEAGDGASVRAIGVSSQGGELQLCDGACRPVGKLISWLDARGAPYDRAMTQRLGADWFAGRIGHAGSGVALGQLLRLRREEPELLKSPNRIGFVGDVIVGRLCGRGAHDATSLSIALMFNPWQRSADPDVLGEVGIREDQLPELIPSTEAAGLLLEPVAVQTGLPAGVPVSPALHDQYAAALGVGAVSAGRVMFDAGTAWVLLAATDRLTEPVAPGAFACTHVVDGLYGQMLSMVNGGSAVRWVLALMGLEGASASEADALAEAAPPGSEGVRFRPLLAPGGGAGLEPGTAGRLAGLRLSHGRAHVMRAVLEGLAMELARHVRMLADAGLPVEALRMCGGGAASRLTPQIIADACALPVDCASEADVSALGAAIIARALTAPGTDLAELSAGMCPETRSFEPSQNVALYREMLERYVASLPTVSPEAPRA